MAHGRQRSSLSVATGLRRRCSADCQGRSAKSPDLMSRPANGRLTALLKLDVEQLKGAVAAPPQSNAVRLPMGPRLVLKAVDSHAKITARRRKQQLVGCLAYGQGRIEEWRCHRCTTSSTWNG
jgi:hypothetical protein